MAINKYYKDSKINLYFALFLLLPIAGLCYQILNENYPQLDRQVLQFFQAERHSLLNLFFISIYQISGAYITAFIVFCALTILVYKRYWQEAKILAFSTLGILILIDKILKPLFDRRRPPKPRLVEDLSWDSFPSGHAAGNLVLYFYLSFVLATRYPKLTKYIYGLATLIIFLIGLSSVYTSAHWLTDVLAGYTFGYFWLLLSLGLLKFFPVNKNNL